MTGHPQTVRYARVGSAITDREHVSYLVEVLEHPHQNGGTYWALEREVGYRPDGTVAWKWPSATNEWDPRIWWAGKKEVDADPIEAAEFEHLWSAPIVQTPSLLSRIRSLLGG